MRWRSQALWKGCVYELGWKPRLSQVSTECLLLADCLTVPRVCGSNVKPSILHGPLLSTVPFL